MSETEAARLLTRMAMLGLGSRPADRAESAIRTQEWAIALEGISEAEATNAAREIASTPGQRFGIKPGDLLEFIYAERLKAAPTRAQPYIPPTPRSRELMDHAEGVAYDNPRWEFTGGREAPLHYIARLAVLAAMVPIGEAVVTAEGGFSCGVPSCVDCTRMPLPPQPKAPPKAPAQAGEIPF